MSTGQLQFPEEEIINRNFQVSFKTGLLYWGFPRKCRLFKGLMLLNSINMIQGFHNHLTYNTAGPIMLLPTLPV